MSSDREMPEGPPMPGTPPFIDAHLHLWDLGRYRYPWLDAPEFDRIRGDYVVTDWRADAVGLDVLATVHVQAELDHSLDPVIETAWLSELRERDGEPTVPTVCVGYADLTSADLGKVLDRHLEYSFVRGIRHEAWYDPATTRRDIAVTNYLADERWVAGLPQLAARGLVFDLLVWHHQLPQAAAVFRAIPDLPVVIEHTGIPDTGDRDAITRWRDALVGFATAVPHACLKLSAMNFIADPWTRAQVGPAVREAIEIFGPRRCMFASNFPVERPSAGYARLWHEYHLMTADMSAAERAALFSGTAAEFYRIP